MYIPFLFFFVRALFLITCQWSGNRRGARETRSQVIPEGHREAVTVLQRRINGFLECQVSVRQSPKERDASEQRGKRHRGTL